MIGLHARPVALLNTRGFYDDFLRYLDRAVADGFWKPQYRAALLVDDDAERLVARLQAAMAGE